VQRAAARTFQIRALTNTLTTITSPAGSFVIHPTLSPGPNHVDCDAASFPLGPQHATAILRVGRMRALYQRMPIGARAIQYQLRRNNLSHPVESALAQLHIAKSRGGPCSEVIGLRFHGSLGNFEPDSMAELIADQRNMLDAIAALAGPTNYISVLKLKTELHMGLSDQLVEGAGQAAQHPP